MDKLRNMGQTFEVDEQVGGSRHALEPLNVLIYCTCSACMLYIKFLSFFVKKVEGTASLHLLFLLKDSHFEQTFRISDWNLKFYIFIYLFIRVISFTTSKMASSLTRAIKRTTNLCNTFRYLKLVKNQSIIL